MARLPSPAEIVFACVACTPVVVAALGGCADGGADAVTEVGPEAAVDSAANDAITEADDATPTDGADGSDGADGADAIDAADAGPEQVAKLTATSGFQIFPGGGYRYGPSIIVNDDGSVEMWTCSPGASGAWDYIRHRHSTDGGKTWSADTIALQPTPGTRDAFSACDPGAVHIGSHWYVGYTSTEDSRGTANNLYIARATSPAGPFSKWDGKGWGGAPQPIVTYGGDASKYGIGEPSLVHLKDKLYVFYSYVDAAGFTDLAIADTPTADGWPLTLSKKGHVIKRRANAEDSTDVKYVDALARFVGVTTYDRFSDNATIGVYQSLDGLTFEPTPYRGARVQPGAHNVGISGTGAGHFDPSKPNFIAYAYQPPGKSWGDWPTFVDPIKLTTVPRGEPVGGAVSTIVDWSWSGPRTWDGDPTTVYSSVSHGATSAASESVAIDLGSSRIVSAVTVTPRGAGLGFPIDFIIQSSADGVTWSDVSGTARTAFPNPGGTAVVLTFGAKVTARWLRLAVSKLGTDDLGNHYLQLGEMSASVE